MDIVMREIFGLLVVPQALSV